MECERESDEEKKVESARMTARRHKSWAFKRIYEPERGMEAGQRKEKRKREKKQGKRVERREWEGWRREKE